MAFTPILRICGLRAVGPLSSLRFTQEKLLSVLLKALRCCLQAMVRIGKDTYV